MKTKQLILAAMILFFTGCATTNSDSPSIPLPSKGFEYVEE